MKTIILAAGMGTRLGKYTENLPKSMLNFLGKPLLERQVETMRACGINDITIVTGYQKEKISIEGVKYYNNDKFKETNMVESLFSAQEELSGDILIAYSDIIYEKKVIQKVMRSKVDIGVTVDEDYWEYWQARLDRPEDDIESLITDDEGKIIELGKPCDRDRARWRYVGLIRLSNYGTKILKKVYDQNRKDYFESNEPWLGSKSFKLGYMTSLLQAIINTGANVKPIKIKRGWLEFDTVNDYDKICKWSKSGQLKKFINLNQ